MADSDLIGAIITAWSQELNSSNPTIKSEANGAMLLARKVGAGNIALIAGAASVTGMEPEKILDEVCRRARYAAQSPRPTRGRNAGKVIARRG